jgi:hypothetical protein
LTLQANYCTNYLQNKSGVTNKKKGYVDHPTASSSMDLDCEQ